METEERENGITFGEICRLIGKKIWLVLAIAAGVTVLAVVLFALVFNPLTTYYSMSFELVYPTSSTQQYPDGTPFSYRNIISLSTLEAAKAKEDRLAEIDVATMIREDHISVSAVTEGDAAADSATVTYTLNVKGSYFRDEDTAQLFIRCVADATVDDIIERAAALSYGISSETFNGNNFEARLDLLAEEYATLLEAYDTWISTYSAGYRVTVNGSRRSLSDYRAEVYGLYVEGVRSALASECENGGYGLLYGDEDEIVVQEAINDRVAQLQQEYALNESIISDLKAQREGLSGSGATASTLSARTLSAQTDTQDNTIVISPDPTLEQRIAYYTERNAVIANQLGAAVDGSSEVTGTLTADGARAFATKLNGYFTSLNAAAETLKNVTTAIYEQNTFAEFISQNADSSGDTNIVLVAVAAFVLAFVIAAIVVCASEYSRQRKQTACPADGEPQDSSERTE